MCKGSDVVSNPLGMAAAPISRQAAIGKALFTPPKMPDVVRTDPVADQKKTETDAAQASAERALLQRRARSATRSCRAGAAGDTSTADVSTPTVYGKPNLGADHVRRNRRRHPRSHRAGEQARRPGARRRPADTAKTQIGDSGAQVSRSRSAASPGHFSAARRSVT
jgi:hypothetical protein